MECMLVELFDSCGNAHAAANAKGIGDIVAVRTSTSVGPAQESLNIPKWSTRCRTGTTSLGFPATYPG